MDLENASWQGHSKFYLPSSSVSNIVAAYMNVSVTMTDMPFYTVDRINIPLGDSEPFYIGEFLSPEAGFINVTPAEMPQVTTQGNIHYWCIDLFRGVTSRLLNLDFSELEIPYLPVSDFSWLMDLHDVVRAAETDDQRITASNVALEAQVKTLAPPDAFEAALFHIYASNAAISAKALAETVGIHRRKLERLFKARIASSPLKELTMAKTFQALEGLVHGESALWHQQNNTGFNDQSHFIRHTRNLTGTTPGQLTGKFIWETNEWRRADTSDLPNTDAVFDAWQAHYAQRISALANRANVPDDAVLADAPSPFRPSGPAPDYPLSPWSVM
ncbi:MAG: helix-turn-helix domain-containing protein [Pseudomonadota bacterium]